MQCLHRPTPCVTHDMLAAPWAYLQVRFVGEGGHDVGGLYRDSITNACEELQSPLLPLLLKPVRGEHGKWFPNPNAATTGDLQQFEVLGTLLGFMTTNLANTLSLDLSRVVWKHIVRDPLDLTDLTALDSGAADQVSNPGAGAHG